MRHHRLWLLLIVCGSVAALGADPPQDSDRARHRTKDRQEDKLARQRDRGGDDDRAHESLDLRQARLSAQLAKVELQKAVDLNQQVPKTVAAADVERLEEVARVAQQTYQQAQHPSRPQASDKARQAEANARIQEENLHKAEEANQRAPDSVQPLELERLRLVSELAQLQVARQNDASGEPMNLGEIQAELRQLRRVVGELKDRVEELEKSGEASK